MSNVLYDTPGPRAKRISAVVSVLVFAAIVYAVYTWLFLPLKADGLFTMKEWGPLINPDYEIKGQKAFPLVWNRIFEGWQATLIAAAIAIAFSLVVGTAIASLRELIASSRGRRFVGHSPVPRSILLGTVFGARGTTKTSVEFFRGLPVVITIFFSYNVLTAYGVDFDERLWYLVIGLTLYNGVVIGEILRSGMAGLPKGQRESAASIGLGTGQTTWLILLPQAFRIMLPALISQLVVILKDTSLGFIIAYEDALAVTRQLNQTLDAPIPLFFTIGLSYILVNYALSKLAQATERRLARRGQAPKEPRRAVVFADAQGSMGPS